ncbi:MAG: hypothetical protein AAB912_01345, partial [Patescibacteria group bacterium]
NCVITAIDVGNCGGCGNRCPNGSECQNGQCSDCMRDSWDGNECNGNCIVCGDMGVDPICVLTANHPFNCGGCGNLCPRGSECQNGQCSDCVRSWDGDEECNGNCVICDSMTDVLGIDRDRVCALTPTDSYNCGRCGNRCAQPTPACNDGRCER